MKDSRNLITLPLMEPSKKAYNSNNNTITKKETQILVDYYEERPIDSKNLEKLHKPAQRLLEKKDMDDEDKLELLYGIETQFTFTGQDKIPVNDIEARFMKGKKENFMVAYKYSICSRLRYQINLHNKHHTKPYRPL